MTSGRVRIIRVIHPEHGEYTAHGVKDRMEAVIQAARSWGEQWSKVAQKARFEEVGQ